MAMRRPTIRLKSADFPTFGRPTMAIKPDMTTVCGSGAGDERGKGWVMKARSQSGSRPKGAKEEGDGYNQKTLSDSGVGIVILVNMAANDLELLGQFAREQSQDAFTELVNRHLSLVYSAALRQVRSPHLAEEVAQAVFTNLARNAAKLSSGTNLSAWLYHVTRHAAIDVVRTEAR